MMILSSFFATPVAHAIGIIDAPTINGFTGSRVMDTAVSVVCTGAAWLFTAAIILSIIFTLLAAIEYMTSAGDPAKTKTATNRLVFAAIGVAVALVAFMLPRIVATTIGTTVGSACSQQ